MKRSTKIILGVVAAAAAAVCVVCCLIIFQYFRGSKVLEEVEQLTGAPDETVQVVPVLPEVVPGQQITTLPGQSEETKNTPPDWYIQVNFEALAGINEDIYAWIDIPGTPVSYAVVQNPEDLYYNNHAVDKSYYTGGSIFSQKYNSKDFTDPDTVLYGHNRESKTMLAPVNDYADQSFFDEHSKIYIYTPDTVYEYEIFAAYPYSSEHLLLNYDFTRESTFTAFFDGLNETIDSHYRRELLPGAGDRVITLSTCYKSNRMQRYLVQGVLTMEYAILREE